MCSVSWKLHRDGYQLGFNRDEKWNRPISADPGLEQIQPVTGACARDGGGGGTWLFTNEYGITLAVMNAYPGGKIPPPGEKSRGQIPLLAACHCSVAALELALQQHPWSDHAPCNLLMIAPSGVRHFGWDGSVFRTLPNPEHPFITTSSVSGEAVRKARTTRYGHISSEPIQHILNDEAADDPAYAIHVRRDDGGTVSQTFVAVNATEIRFCVARRGEQAIVTIFPRKP